MRKLKNMFLNSLAVHKAALPWVGRYPASRNALAATEEAPRPERKIRKMTSNNLMKDSQTQMTVISKITWDHLETGFWKLRSHTYSLKRDQTTSCKSLRKPSNISLNRSILTRSSEQKTEYKRPSLSFSSWSLHPPKSLYVTSGFSSTVIIVTVGSIAGGRGIWIWYLFPSTPTRIPSSMSVGDTFCPKATTNFAYWNNEEHFQPRRR